MELSEMTSIASKSQKCVSIWVSIFGRATLNILGLLTFLCRFLQLDCW